LIPQIRPYETELFLQLHDPCSTHQSKAVISLSNFVIGTPDLEVEGSDNEKEQQNILDKSVFDDGDDDNDPGKKL
jgi:hypothetical protein